MLAYLDQLAIWLLKTAVWMEHRRWLGPDTGHDPRFLLHGTKASGACWCGSGRRYGDCHLDSNAVAVMRALGGRYGLV